MNQLITKEQNGDLAMSSRDIAALVESRHDSVKRAIERLADRGVIGSPPSVEYRDSLNRAAQEFQISKRDSYVIVAQLSPEFTARLVDRWQELEGSADNNAILKHISPVAKVLIEDLNAQLDHEKSETSRLQTVCNDLALNLREGMTVVAFCRSLNGVNLSRVQTDLVSRKRLLSTKHGYRSASAYRDKLFTERHERLDDGRLTEKVILTRRGAKWLYAEYENDRLAMKKGWNREYTHILFDDVEVAA